MLSWWQSSNTWYPRGMKHTIILLLAISVLVAGCTVWVQAAGRNATSSQTGNNEDNQNRSVDRTPTASETKEK